jgi:hypothetical protein
MPIAATVITDVELLAAIALIYMAAHGRCSASTDGVQGALMPAGKSLRRDIFLLQIQYIGHLEEAAHYSKRVSKGLNFRELPVLATCKYTNVVSIKACPKSSFKLMILSPSSSKCVA